MPLVTVGDPGNTADTLTGLGAVPYEYSMGKYDVTVSEYTTFLNAVATTSDPYGLYTPGMATDLPTYGIIRTSSSGVYSYSVKSIGPNPGNVPVFDVNFGDALRFINWMANKQSAERSPKDRAQRKREATTLTARRAMRRLWQSHATRGRHGFCLPLMSGISQHTMLEGAPILDTGLMPPNRMMCQVMYFHPGYSIDSTDRNR